jgi:hypothetical protein
MQGIGCLTSRDIEDVAADVVVVGSSSDDMESSSEEWLMSCMFAFGELDNIAIGLRSLLVVSLGQSWLELVGAGWSVVGCTWVCRVGYMGFGRVGSTFLLGGLIVFLCLLWFGLCWRSSFSVSVVRLLSFLT